MGAGPYSLACLRFVLADRGNPGLFSWTEALRNFLAELGHASIPNRRSQKQDGHPSQDLPVVDDGIHSSKVGEMGCVPWFSSRKENDCREARAASVVPPAIQTFIFLRRAAVADYIIAVDPKDPRLLFSL